LIFYVCHLLYFYLIYYNFEYNFRTLIFCITITNKKQKILEVGLEDGIQYLLIKKEKYIIHYLVTTKLGVRAGVFLSISISLLISVSLSFYYYKRKRGKGHSLTFQLGLKTIFSSWEKIFLTNNSTLCNIMLSKHYSIK
jgi:hypothetical protein